MEFFTITCIGLLMIISPGPDFAIATKTSIASGRWAGLGVAWGIALANLCHVLLNLLGIGILIANSVLAFTVLKILGAVYLVYIGYKGLRAKPDMQHLLQKDTDEEKEQKNLSGQKGFYIGFLTSILNPKVCLFFLSFFSVLISPSTPIFTQFCYGIWICTIALLWFSLVALFFTHPKIAAKLKRAKHWIERVAGGALVLLGLRLLSSKAAIS